MLASKAYVWWKLFVVNKQKRIYLFSVKRVESYIPNLCNIPCPSCIRYLFPEHSGLFLGAVWLIDIHSNETILSVYVGGVGQLKANR